MSKKTSAIYKCIDNLEELRKRFICCCKNDEDSLNEDSVSVTGESKIQELDDIDFQIQQELKTLKFWFDSLYQYNGKATSISKKAASAKNGLKGGRPPKEISITKLRIIELQDEVIPELDHKIIMADSNDELMELEEQRKNAEEELYNCKNKIDIWIKSKK